MNARLYSRATELARQCRLIKRGNSGYRNLSPSELGWRSIQKAVQSPFALLSASEAMTFVRSFPTLSHWHKEHGAR
jgi:hypothetical protein